jgi:hypothetical protein
MARRMRSCKAWDSLTVLFATRVASAGSGGGISGLYPAERWCAAPSGSPFSGSAPVARQALETRSEEDFSTGKTLVLSLASVSQSCLSLREVACGQSGTRKPLNEKPLGLNPRGLNWVQSLDLNQGPSGYEPDSRIVPSDLTRRLRSGRVMDGRNCEKELLTDSLNEKHHVFW